LDAVANVQTGYEFGRHGDPYLSNEAAIRDFWSVRVGDEFVSHYPPGAALHVAPLYAVWPSDARVARALIIGEERDLRIPPLAPAAIVSAAVTALAVGLVAVASNRLVSSWHAVGAGIALGVGTGAWAVASDQLWQHGPAMMWVAAGMVLSVNRPLGGGFAFGIAAITRPHAALVGLGVAGARRFEDRKLWPAVGIAGLTAKGVAAVVAYNAWVFGGASISGGYSEGFVARLLALDNLRWFAGNVVGSLIDPARGLIVYSPFLLFLIPGLPYAWRDSPWWARGAAVGGLLYLVVQLKANRFSGGEFFFSYRYPLEAPTAAAPLLALAYAGWVAR